MSGLKRRRARQNARNEVLKANGGKLPEVAPAPEIELDEASRAECKPWHCGSPYLIVLAIEILKRAGLMSEQMRADLPYCSVDRLAGLVTFARGRLSQEELDEIDGKEPTLPHPISHTYPIGEIGPRRYLHRV